MEVTRGVGTAMWHSSSTDGQFERKGVEFVTSKVSTGETFGRGSNVDRDLKQGGVANSPMYSWLEQSVG